MKKFSFKKTLEIFKTTFKGFSDDKVTKLSGSLAYSVVFSLGPLLLVIISLCGIFLGRAAVEGKIYEKLSTSIGSDTAIQLQQIIKNLNTGGKSKIAAIIGIVVLIISATSIFAEIQDSINSIWGLKSKPKTGWFKMVQNRLLSFSVIIGLGFIMLVSLSINSVIDAFSDKLQTIFPDITIAIIYTLNIIITFLITTSIFGVIFKILPDAIIKWKDIIVGAIATAILFMAGRFAISFYISKSNIGSTYGAAGSMIVLLLWVYYSSLILYFGAELTKAYAVANEIPIQPNQYSIITKTVEVEQ